MYALVAGAVEVIVGATVSLVKLMLVEPVLPAKSVSLAYRVKLPWLSPAQPVKLLMAVVPLTQLIEVTKLSSEQRGLVSWLSVNEIVCVPFT